MYWHTYKIREHRLTTGWRRKNFHEVMTMVILQRGDQHLAFFSGFNVASI